MSGKSRKRKPDAVRIEPIPVEQPEVGVFRETVETIDRYWFGFGSPTALGVFRIVMGSLSVCALLMLLTDFDAWYTERGFVPAWLGARYIGSRAAFGLGPNFTLPRIGVLNGVTDPRITMAVFVSTILAGIFTAFGLWTRVSSILLAIGVVSIQHRNAAILHGGDSVTRLGCMYLALAPSGAACSIDRLIALWKGKISKAPVLVSMWPQRLIAANVALIYLMTMWLKWQGGMWQDGTATYYPVRLPMFQRFAVPQFINDIPFVYFTTYGTLLLEFSMGTLVFFRPLRKYVLLAAVLMHSEIEYSMNIPLFSYFIVSTYICFFDGEEISAWAGRLGEWASKWRVTLNLPVGMRFKPNAEAFLDSIDPFKLVRYVPGSTAEWTASRANGTGLAVSKAIRTRCVGSWIFGWYPGVWDRILRKAIEPFEQ